LVKAYRAFVKKHGRIKEFTVYERTVENDEGEKVTTAYRKFKWQKLGALDVEGPLVESLERITDAGELVDGPFLLGRTLNKPARREINSVGDALAVNLDEIGRLNLDYIAELSGKTAQEVIDELGDRIFKTPSGEWQTDDEYLSGNVLEKLEEAKAAAATEPEFQRNVDALVAVQPAPLSFSNITVKLGAPWLKPETVQQFADEVLGWPDTPITYEAATAQWTVAGAKQQYRRSATDDFGTTRRSSIELLDAVLNNRTIKITDKDEKKKDIPNEAETAAANEKAKLIRERFAAWLWEDAARTTEYVDLYNRTYNNIAPRKFNGDHLTLPGLSSRFTLYAHQKRCGGKSRPATPTSLTRSERARRSR
jgi:N12 class adenine-specific DNA methylase